MMGFAYIILAILFIGLSDGQVVVPCNFNQTETRGYECRLPDVRLCEFESFVIQGGTHLPGFNDLMVTSFFSIHNCFTEFPTTHLARFPNLQHIKVSESELTEFPAGAVINRPALQTLSLSANFITTLDPAAFTNSNNIRSLTLQFNQLRNLDNAWIAALPSLQELDISFNIIENVPGITFSNTRQLHSINMNNNRINFLNETFFNNLPVLRSFFFQNNLCQSDQFLGLDNALNRNQMMTRLQPCFVQGPSQFNCIFGFAFDGLLFDDYTCLLRGIEAYDMSREINLGGFHIQGRNDNDVLFVWVDASDTRFVINQVFRHFINVRHMQISTSNLQSLQINAFQGANNLQRLTIDGNNLRRLEANSFLHAIILREIFLWTNGLEYVHENAFFGLFQLQELHLFGGHLTTFHPNTFVNLINLRFVEVSYNHIEILDSRWFGNNTLINRIHFNNNEIYAVAPTLVDHPGLRYLQLLNNTCVSDIFTITNENREEVREQLNPCFINYPTKVRRYCFDLEGSISLYYTNGTLVGHL